MPEKEGKMKLYRKSDGEDEERKHGACPPFVFPYFFLSKCPLPVSFPLLKALPSIY